ncbi:DNA repair protein rad16 [Mucor circinelloides]
MTTSSRLDTALNNYFDIFEMLLRMRQCADLPDLIAKKKTDNQQLVRLPYNNLI